MSKPLKPKARSLALAIAAGKSVRAAARKLGIPERTAYRITATPEFQELVADLQAQVVRQAVATLASGTHAAAATLLKLAKTSKDERVQVRASRSVLEFFAALDTYSNLKTRFEAMEKAADEKLRKSGKAH
jgi:hypothetical protein